MRNVLKKSLQNLISPVGWACEKGMLSNKKHPKWHTITSICALVLASYVGYKNYENVTDLTSYKQIFGLVQNADVPNYALNKIYCNIPTRSSKKEFSRKVTVAVCADEEIRDLYSSVKKDWKRGLDIILKLPFERFKKAYGIDFQTTEYLEWGSNDELKSEDGDIYKLLAESRKEIKTNADIVIAFTGQDTMKTRHIPGTNESLIYGKSSLSYPFGRNVLIGYANDRTENIADLLEELAHVFGANHKEGETCVSIKEMGPFTYFVLENGVSETIKKHKPRIFLKF